MTSETYREPESLDEWQDAADFAETCLAIDSARCYGLITGGPEINVKRCQELLSRAADRGIAPHDDAVSRCMPALMEGDEP